MLTKGTHFVIVDYVDIPMEQREKPSAQKEQRREFRAGRDAY